MAITDPVVLPADVILVPVENLPAHLREQVKCEAGDYAVTRPRSRTPSRIVDAQAAELLKEFRTPKTIVDAVISYSRSKEIDPEETLVEAFPMIERFVMSRLLVPPDSEEARHIAPSYEIGDHVAGFEVLHCIQVLEDTELYQVTRGKGVQAALKILRAGCGHEVQRTFEREAAILRSLDGQVNPTLLETGSFEDRAYLIIEWCAGVHAPVAAEEFRRLPGIEGRTKLLLLCCAILDAYAHLHSQHVIHSDVHPRNVLVTADSSVKIIDYGLARLDVPASEYAAAHRGGIAFFFEPELALAARMGHRQPMSSRAGEQYALAAMLYSLLTGTHYLEFSLDKDEMLRQITEDNPAPFSSRGVPPWPDVEALLARALSKNPIARFPSVADFARHVRDVAPPPERNSLPHVGTAPPLDRIAAEALLEEVIERVGAAGPLLPAGITTAPTCSVNNGAAGIAYALYRIACIRGDAALLSLADIWSTKAVHDSGSNTAFYNEKIELTPEIAGPISLYHTASGVHCVRALISHAMGDMASQMAAAEAFIRASQAPCENLDLTLGRSGTLLGCSMLLDTLQDNYLLDENAMRDFGTGVMRGIWDVIDGYGPIGECPEITFLGIAHGWAGVLYATLRWCHSSGADLPLVAKARLLQLAAYAEPTGRGLRWKRKLGLKGHERVYEYVPSWCNGSAGFVYLWTLAHSMFGEEAYLRLAEGAAWNTWEDPDTMGDLCCGLGGRAYALLNLYKHTNDQDWLTRAQQLANGSVANIKSWAVLPDSLYKGFTGIAVLASDLSKPKESCAPLFEQEGWPAR